MVRALTVLEPHPARRAGIALVVLRGDVDACDQATLERTRIALAGATAVHLDLAELGFCGTTFLRFLAHVVRQTRATGGGLFLRRVPPRVVSLLALAGMDAPFEPRTERGITTLRLRPRATAPVAAAHAGGPAAGRALDADPPRGTPRERPHARRAVECAPADPPGERGK